jgi:hypothetical protein
MSVSVIVQGSDGFNGFDVTLKANHTIIKPADASLVGSILSDGTIFDKCIGGVLKAGPTCPSTDTVDTIHLVVVRQFLTFAPTTALLFTATYNVTGTATTPISFQTGCTPSSVNGTTTCVTLTNGSTSNPLLKAQTASYTAAPAPTFAMASSRGDISLGKGETGNSTLTLVSLNGFVGSVALSITFNPAERHPPVFSTNPSTVPLTSGGSNTALFIVSTRDNTDKLTYSVTITASSAGVIDAIQIRVSVLP